ncbi:cytochrome c biogenesis CcdA family protein [Geopsychrobacter electrodiphilus]|uniref:cytochrome c biogenesis CcdA family protein n=1 Tax=Geopsychrobacter electrodiphilus TaxID=225196 RepID=UPI000368A73F|nr:cytochrome c biogenesis protein CcdA [Geopsychrobacter electrodiphilus]
METDINLSLWIAFSAGALSFSSPCVLPLLPSYVSYITGLTFGQLQEEHPGAKARLTVLLHTLVFILGFSAVFVSLGAIAGLASQAFQLYFREGLGWLQRGGGVLIFLFGIHLTGLFHFGILLGDKRVQVPNKPKGFLGTFLVGVVFAAGWTPCIGPILGAILALAAGTNSSAGQGVVLLSFYSAGLGIPFLISAMLFHGFLSAFKRFRKHIRLVEIVTGVMLMAVGAMLFLDYYARLTSYLFQWFPATG